MTTSFAHYLKMVTAGHLAVLTAACLASSIRSCARGRAPQVFPVGLVLDAAPSVVGPAERPSPARVEPSAPTPAPAPAAVPKPPAPSPSVSKTGAKSTVSVNKPSPRKPPAVQAPSQPPKPRVTARQLKELENILNRRSGGVPVGRPDGSPTISGAILDDEMRGLSLIRETLYEAWIVRPSEDEVGKSVAEVALRFDRDGRILARELAKSSGHRGMDKSALDAAAAVERIVGLSEEFLKRHDYRLVVAFQLGEE